MNFLTTITKAILMLLCLCKSKKAEHVDKKDDYVWEAAKAFNDQYGIKSWTIHYDGNSSMLSLRSIMKNSNSSYFMSFRDIDSDKEMLWTPERASHLYIAKDFDPLSHLLTIQNDLFSQINKDKKQMISMNMWLIVVDSSDKKSGVTLLNKLKSARLRLDSHAFAFHKDSENGIDIQDVYKMSPTSENLVTVKYGSWDLLNGISVSERIIWKRRSNFNGFQIRISSDVWPNMQTVVEDGCTSADCFKGWYADLFNLMQPILNFTFVVTKNGVAGIELENGSWTGQIGLVLDGKVDFAADSFGITEIRSRVISYLPLFAGGKSRIYIKNPRETFDWEVYTKPFRKVTWVGVMSFSVILPVLMVITMVNLKESPHKTWYLSDCYNAMYRSLLLLGVNLYADSFRKRVTWCSILFAGMLLYWLWEAQLISYFSFPIKTLPFNNLEEFLSETDNKLIVIKGSMHEQFFRSSKLPTVQRVWKERIQPYISKDPVYQNWDYCQILQKVVDDESYSAYINAGGDGHFQRCDTYYKCKIVMVPHVIWESFGGGWIFPKRSPLFPFFNLHINAMKERGIYSRIGGSYNEFERMPGQICKEYDGEAIGINKTFSLFGIIFTGIGLSVIIFILEHTFPEKWFKSANEFQGNLHENVLVSRMQR